jgi:hypothetical protein
MAGPDERLRAPAPVFDPLTFFAGRSQGEGSLKIIFKGREQIRVESTGAVGKWDELVLDQVISRGERPPERRQWRLKKVLTQPGRYTGWLTEAAGLVEANANGNELHIQYRTKSGERVHQWLYLQPDARTALNRMSITKFGVEVARLTETIRKLD